MRPTKEDREALRILLGREDLSDRNAEFVDSIRNWEGTWTPRQAEYFDSICEKYF